MRSFCSLKKGLLVLWNWGILIMISNIPLPLLFMRQEGDCFSKKTSDNTIGLMCTVTAGSGRRRKRKEVKEILVSRQSSGFPNNFCM